MRILVLTDQFPPNDFGGMAQHAYHMTKYLSRQHEVLVATMLNQATSVYDQENFVIKPLLTKRFPQFDSLRLLHLAHRFKVDVIHSCTAGLADEKLSAKYPIVTRVVGNDFLRPWCGYNLPLRGLLYRLPGSKIKMFVNRIEMKRRKNVVINQLLQSTFIVTNSRWTQERLLENGVNDKSIKTVIGGLDMKIFRPTSLKRFVRQSLGLPEEEQIIMTAGNMIRKKGFDTILRVMQRIKADRPLHYILAGNGPESENLRRLAADLGVNGQCFFIGHKKQTELAMYYQATDVYVSATQEESMGRTYFEAGACGIPVVGTRVGGVDDVVKDGENGLLVDDPKDVVAITRCVRRLLISPALRERMGNEGFRRARRNFTWDMVGERFEALFYKAVERCSDRTGKSYSVLSTS